jgi:protein phosphatase
MRKIIKQISKNKKKGAFNRAKDRVDFVSGDAQETDIAKTKYRVASCQSTGKARPNNEDTLLTLNAYISGLDMPIAFGFYLVADGMGGHQSGEIASNYAAQGISQYLMSHVYQRTLFERRTLTSSDLREHLKNAVEEAQTLVLQRVPGGGTTLTCVLTFGDELFFAHIGDSRLYHLKKDGSLILHTRDHTLVKRLVDLGEITEDDAELHSHRSILYKALGQSDPFEPDIGEFSLEVGERLLICSDGLWGVVAHQQLQHIIQNSEDLDAAATNLVKAANDGGGPDNISVILIERLT